MDMKELNIEIDNDSFHSMVKLAVFLKQYEKVFKLFAIMKKMGFEIDEETRDLIYHEGFNPIEKMKTMMK